MKDGKSAILDILTQCATACERCFDSCLRENDISMFAECIRLDKECAQVCRLAASLIASGSAYAAEVVDICSDICAGCAGECEKHDHEHCRICAVACRQCEEACQNFAPSSS
ncbi:MAG: four-helix bundle copper-binding protein [Chitinophagales bacterium]